MGKRGIHRKAVCQGTFSTTADKVEGVRKGSCKTNNSDAKIIKPLWVTLQDFGPLPSISCLGCIYSGCKHPDGWSSMKTCTAVSGLLRLTGLMSYIEIAAGLFQANNADR